MQKPLVRDPAFLFHQNAMHDRDLARGAAEAEARDTQPDPKGVVQRHPVLRLPLFGDRDLSQCVTRGWANSQCGSFEGACLSALLSKVLVEVVEDFGPTRDPLRIILGRYTDTLHQRSNPCDFGSPELAVLEIDIVDDLADGAKRCVFEAASVEQDLEGAFVALVREFRLEHVEAQLAFFRPI